MADALALGRLEAGRLFHHHIAIHHNQAPVGVPDEPRVAGQADHPGDRRGREADVEDRFHHAGHRGPGARAATDQEGVGRVAEPLAHGLLDAREGLHHGGFKFLRILPAIPVIIGAYFSRDRKTRRHGDLEEDHLGEVRAFAAKEFLHVGPAVGLSGTEEINIFSCLSHFPSPRSCWAPGFIPRAPAVWKKGAPASLARLPDRTTLYILAGAPRQPFSWPRQRRRARTAAPYGKRKCL